jgi:hypothetical protein
MEEIKDVEVRHAIFDCLHILIFMTSTFGRPLNLSRHMGKRRWWSVLIPLSLVMHGLYNFGLTIGPSWYIPPLLSNICSHFLY